MLDPAWYEAIGRRISRRRFTGEPIPGKVLAGLRSFCETFAPAAIPSAARTRTVLVERAPADLFTGLVGSYGRVDGAPSAALLVGEEDSQLEIGYVGEAFVLEATRVGLDTCWIAGTFSHKRADSLAGLAPEERLPAIVAVGIAEADMATGERTMRAFARASSRMSAEKIAYGADLDEWPPWARSAAEAARWAPSGANMQPWRFRLESGSLVLSEATRHYWTVRMDLGIAMLHAELGAQHAGTTGRWERLDNTHDVARFIPD